MNILGVIPARFASTRFPGKPLVMIQGKAMIERVYAQASKAGSLARVVVATDDERIQAYVSSFGGEVIMTSPSHPTGTDRLIEVADRLAPYDAYINIQGDEPFIDPAQIDKVGELLQAREGTFVATLVKRLADLADLHNPNVVTVARALDGRALYFSRSPIPFVRKAGAEAEWHAANGFVKHIGIYGYTRGALAAIKAMQPGILEQAESLEQLRWLEHGLPVYTAETDIETQAVDTPEDLAKLGVS